MKYDCQKILGQLDDWIDGMLDAVELGELQDHLADCDSCRTTFDAHSALLGDLRALGGLADRAVAKFSVAGPQSEWPRVFRIAAMVVLVVGVATAVRTYLGRAPLQDVSRDTIAMSQEDKIKLPSIGMTPEVRLAADDPRFIVNDKSKNPRIHILWLYEPAQKLNEQLNKANLHRENITNG